MFLVMCFVICDQSERKDALNIDPNVRKLNDTDLIRSSHISFLLVVGGSWFGVETVVDFSPVAIDGG